MFDHVIQRNERLSKAIGGDTCCENGDVTSITDKSPKSDSHESTEKKTDSKPDDLTKKSKAEVDKSDTPETEKAGRKISRGGASQMRPSPKKQQQQTAAFKTQQVEHLLS